MNRKQAIEVAVKSGGNRTSNKPGHAPASNGKTDAKAPAKAPAEMNKGTLETPKIAGQQMDPWAQAAEKLKGYFR